MAEETITIRQVSAAEVVDLRHRILRGGLPRSTAIFAGDDAPAAIHLAAFEGEIMIGCASLHRTDKATCQLRGMAIDTHRQRTGAGKLLLAEAERRAATSGAEKLWANCRAPAVPFYEKFGWETASEEFNIETAGPHVKMMKSLK